MSNTYPKSNEEVIDLMIDQNKSDDDNTSTVMSLLLKVNSTNKTESCTSNDSNNIF